MLKLELASVGQSSCESQLAKNPISLIDQRSKREIACSQQLAALCDTAEIFEDTYRYDRLVRAPGPARF